MRGICLTIDLCPSRKPLDRSLIQDILAAFEKVERPVPLAISLSGLWMEKHPDDLRWLVKNQKPGPGSIVLIHGNGNEPLGIAKFLALIGSERTAIKKKKWLLWDLRDSLIQSE